MSRWLLLALAALAAPAAAQQLPIAVSDVFVGNQGRPASLTAYRPGETTSTSLFASQLSGFLQGTELMDDRLYVTGNGTRIDVVDPRTRVRVAQIADPAFAAARYLAQATPTKAYVTTQNYAAGATTAEVVVLNLETNTVAGRIAVPLQPEGLAVSGGRAFVALGGFGGRPELTVVDVATDAVVGQVALGCAARFVLADDDGEVHAVCTGTGEVVAVTAATLAVARRVAVGQTLGSAFGIGQDAALVPATTQSPAERLVLATAAGVVFVSTDAATVGPSVAIADAAARPVSALGFDSFMGRLYLGRPDATGPFSAAGTLTVHSAAGALEQTVAAGIFPSHLSMYGIAVLSSEGSPGAGGLRVGAASPNPARGAAVLPVTLAEPREVRLALFDALGREVAAWAGALGAGAHRLPLGLGGLPAGVYAARVQAGEASASVRVTVAR